MFAYTVTALATYPNKRAFLKSELSICVGHVILNHLVVAQMKLKTDSLYNRKKALRISKQRKLTTNVTRHNEPCHGLLNI